MHPDIGGGGITTLMQVIDCNIMPTQAAAKIIPMVIGVWSVGSIVGPVVGGALTENAS